MVWGEGLDAETYKHPPERALWAQGTGAPKSGTPQGTPTLIPTLNPCLSVTEGHQTEGPVSSNPCFCPVTANFRCYWPCPLPCPLPSHTVSSPSLCSLRPTWGPADRCSVNVWGTPDRQALGWNFRHRDLAVSPAEPHSRGLDPVGTGPGWREGTQGL